MKSLLAIWVVFGLTIGSNTDGGGKKYGKELTLKQKTSVADLLSHPEKFKGKRVLIEGRITDVCQMKGCWIKVADDSKSDPIQVKVEDDLIVFPKDGKGKKVKAEGVVSVTTLSEEELINRAKHEAEEQGKLKEFDASKIKGPKTMVRIDGEGAVIEE